MIHNNIVTYSRKLKHATHEQKFKNATALAILENLICLALVIDENGLTKNPENICKKI